MKRDDSQSTPLPGAPEERPRPSEAGPVDRATHRTHTPPLPTARTPFPPGGLAVSLPLRERPTAARTADSENGTPGPGSLPTTGVHEPEGPTSVHEPEGPTSVHEPEGPTSVHEPEGPTEVRTPTPPARVATPEPEGQTGVHEPEGPTDVHEPEGPTSVHEPSPTAVRPPSRPRHPAVVDAPVETPAPEPATGIIQLGRPPKAPAGAPPAGAKAGAAPADLHVDSGVLPLPTTPPPAPAGAGFEAPIDVDQGLVEQLAAGLGEAPPDERGERPAAAPPLRVSPQAIPYWESRLSRLRAEIALCDLESEKPRAALLHFETGRICEQRLGRASDALAAYQAAFELDPGFGPNLRALRRALLRRGSFAEALPAATAELEATSAPTERAALLIERGRLRERLLDDADGGERDYLAALEIDPEDHVALLLLGDIYHRRGDFERLCELYERRAAQARDPVLRGSLLCEAAVLCEDRLGDLARATDLYHRAQEIHSASRPAIRALARIYRRQERFVELVGVYEQAAEIAATPEEAATWLHRAARVYRDRLRDRDRAVQLLERAVHKCPSDRAILVDLAGLYEEQRRFPELTQTLARAAELAGDPRQAAQLQYRLAQTALVRLHDEEQAVAALREAVSRAPDHHPARRALGKLYARRERWLELIGLLADEAAQTEDPEHRAARYFRIADIYDHRLGDLERAAQHYERALGTHAGFAPALTGLGRAADALGRYDDLVQAYERELALARDRDEQAHLLGRIAQVWEERLGDPAAAVQSYERLLAVVPNHPVALRALGRLYAQGERWRDLVEVHMREAEHLADAAQIVPLLVRSGEVYEDKLGDPDRAIACYRQALTLRPDFLPALLQLGRLTRRLGRFEDLIEMYRREIEVSRDPAQMKLLSYKIGEILEELLGRPDEAARAYLDALRHDPQFQPARDALARLHEARGNWTELALLLGRGREPEGPRARSAHFYRLGEIQEWHLHNAGAAVESYRRALKAHPAEAAAAVALERLLVAAGDRQGLIALYAGPPGAPPSESSPPALLKLARLWCAEEHDLDRAAQALERLLEIEPQNRFARRELERLLMRIERWDLLFGLLDAERKNTQDPRWEVACALEMAAIREYKLADTRGAAEIYYQVLARDPNHWQALGALEVHYRATGNTSGLIQVLARYAALAGSPAEAACYLCSVGAGLEACGAPDRAIRVYHEALERLPGYLPALRALGRIYREREDVPAMALALEAEARASLDRPRRAALEVDAAELWQSRQEEDRAILAYRRALESDPAHPTANAALELLFSAREAWGELAELLAAAAQRADEGTARRDLEVRLYQLYREKLGDDLRAKAALRRALEIDARHLPSLHALRELCRSNGEWGELADVDMRLLPLVRHDALALHALHVELGALWDEKLPDARRAVEHYQRALALDPTDLGTLDRLSLLQVRERDFPAAEETTKALVAKCPDRSQKIRIYLRLAQIYADGFGDLERAVGACRDALALDPMDLEASERLAVVLGRLKEWRTLGSHLDGVLRQHRTRIAEQPWRPDSYQALRKIFEWQKAYDKVYCAAQVLHLFGASRAEDEAFLRANQPAATNGAVLPALTDNMVEQHLISPSERGSLREILRIGEEALERLYPPDLARHQVSRTHRVTVRTHPRLWEVLTEVAHVFAVPDFELYLSPGQIDAAALESAQPPQIILGTRWAQNADPVELRFLFGRALGRVRAHLAGTLKLPAEELGHFIAALLAIEVGSFVPPYPSQVIEPLVRRIQKLLPKKALRALGPYALEVAGARFQPGSWKRAFEATALRAGTLMCRDISRAVELSLRLDGAYYDPTPPRNVEELARRIERSPGAQDVLVFAVSEDHFAMRQLLGISVSP